MNRFKLIALIALIALFALVSGVGFAAGKSVQDFGNANIKCLGLPYVEAEQSADSTHPTGAFAPLNFATEISDPDNEFNGTSFTPKETAFYLLSFTVALATGATSMDITAVPTTGGIALPREYQSYAATGGIVAGGQVIRGTWLLYLTAGTSTRIDLSQNSGAGITLVAIRSVFRAKKIL